METVQTLLMVLEVLVAIVLIGFILIQQGKGADAGAAFGSGASATVFGARGSGNFLSRTTAVLATIFLVNSLVLAWVARERMREAGSIMDTAVTAPADPATGMPVDSAAVSAPVTEAAVDTSVAAPDSEVPSAPAMDSEVPTAPATDSEVPAVPQQQ